MMSFTFSALIYDYEFVNVLVNLNWRELAGFTLSVNELLIEKKKSCFRTMISVSHNNETMQCQLFY